MPDRDVMDSPEFGEGFSFVVAPSPPLGMSLRIGRQSVDVLDTLECRWIRTILLAHAAFELRYGVIVVLDHPAAHGGLDGLNIVDAVTEQHGAKHGHIGSRHENLQNVEPAMNSAGGSQ